MSISRHGLARVRCARTHERRYVALKFSAMPTRDAEVRAMHKYCAFFSELPPLFRPPLAALDAAPDEADLYESPDSDAELPDSMSSSELA